MRRRRRGRLLHGMRRRLMMMMLLVMNHGLGRRRRRRRRRKPNHAIAIAFRAGLRRPAEETARHIAAPLAARAPGPSGIRLGAGRQRPDAAEGVRRAERQRACHQKSECTSVEFHFFVPFGCGHFTTLRPFVLYFEHGQPTDSCHLRGARVLPARRTRRAHHGLLQGLSPPLRLVPQPRGPVPTARNPLQREAVRPLRELPRHPARRPAGPRKGLSPAGQGRVRTSLDHPRTRR